MGFGAVGRATPGDTVGLVFTDRVVETCRCDNFSHEDGGRGDLARPGRPLSLPAGRERGRPGLARSPRPPSSWEKLSHRHVSTTRSVKTSPTVSPGVALPTAPNPIGSTGRWLSRCGTLR